MTELALTTAGRVVSQDGAAARLSAIAHHCGMRHALLVTDRALRTLGVLDEVLRRFAGSGVALSIFDGVEADPPESCIAAAVAQARESNADGVIGIGGGSSLDVAKLVSLLARTSQPLAEAYGIGNARGPRWPLILVPTTAGTGSEVTPISIVTTSTSEKMGVVSPLLFPDVAVLDATLTLGLPARVTAMTGIDAMVHAIEAYTSRHKKNLISDALALRALALLSDNLRRVLVDGSSLDARRAMLEGSMLAGMAFANAPVAAVHALAYPIGGHFHVPHGLSNALVLIPVLEFNLPIVSHMYGELASALRQDGRSTCASPTGEEFVLAMRAQVDDLGLERRLRDVGVQVADIETLAIDAMKVQRLLVNNPREVTLDDARALYQQAF